MAKEIVVIKRGFSGKNKLLTSVISLLLFFLIDSTESYASYLKDDYLWIEFGKQIKEKVGSVAQPLFIYFGKFPDKRKEIWKLDTLRAFYTSNEKDEEGNRIFYEAKVEREQKKYRVRIRSFKKNRFIVLIEGKRTQGKDTHYYLAKTSFILYGHCPSERKKTRPVWSAEINRQFEICTTPEFFSWRQTDSPVKITLLFNQTPLRNRLVSIFDENLGTMGVTTDETANYTYIPQEDKKLNLQGIIASKHAIVVAREGKENADYISSYTLLLHRNRFKNRSPVLGAGIFWGLVAGVLLLVVAKRKRFEV